MLEAKGRKVYFLFQNLNITSLMYSLMYTYVLIKFVFVFFDIILVLTSSIENKIRDFAKAHPEASKQANLARSLLPSLPLSDEKYSDATKEISRRAVEFDDIEDTFDVEKNKQIPDILKEHFRRNSEESVNFDDDVREKREINGEEQLSRNHRNVQDAGMEFTDDDYESLFQQ